jgi:hypothetical protein
VPSFPPEIERPYATGALDKSKVVRDATGSSRRFRRAFLGPIWHLEGGHRLNCLQLELSLGVIKSAPGSPTGTAVSLTSKPG